eukprot:714798-Pyramimonas_sp.AAC.1
MKVLTELQQDMRARAPNNLPTHQSEECSIERAQSDNIAYVSSTQSLLKCKAMHAKHSYTV